VNANPDLLPHTRDLILHLQLATLQLGDCQIIRRRVRLCFVYFIFQRLVPSLKFRKVRLNGHVAYLLLSDCCLTRAFYTSPNIRNDTPFHLSGKSPAVHCRSRSSAALRGVNQNAIITGILPPVAVLGRDETAAMTQDEERELRAQLARLLQEHRDLDAAIAALQDSPGSDIIQVQRLKKRKLHLKDRIIFIEDQLTPDIIA
jgi:hypothetical protein